MDEPDITPERHENARRLYCETRTPVLTIIAELGVTERRFYRLRKRWGWPLRRPDRAGCGAFRPNAPPAATSAPERPQGLAAAAEDPASRDGEAERPPPQPAAQRSDPHTLMAVLARIARQDLARLDAVADEDARLSAESRARTVASLVRSLKELGHLAERHEGEDHHAPDPPPRSLNELRDELYRRLVRIRAERRLARRARRVDASRG